MKITIINLSGNTGKTTLARHLFTPQLPNAKRVQIEDVNMGDDQPDMELAAGKFKALAAELNIAAADEHFVIDIGASNARLMMEHFYKLKSTRAGIDYWVIPVVPASKQRADSLNTVKSLINIGVEPEKIILILNNIIDIEAVPEEFSTIFHVRIKGIHVIEEFVLSSEVYEMLKNKPHTVFAMANNPPNFKNLIQETRLKGDNKALEKLGQQQVLQDMAEAAAGNLKVVFEATPIFAALMAQPTTTAA